MHSYQRAIAVALATFGASVLGMALQLVVPAQVLADSRGTVGAMVGLITLLPALVLGLGNVVLSCGGGNRVDLHRLPGGAEGIRTDGRRGAGHTRRP